MMRPYRSRVPAGSGCTFHSIENLDSHPGTIESYSVVCVSGLPADAQAETAAASRLSLIHVTMIRGRSFMTLSVSLGLRPVKVVDRPSRSRQVHGRWKTTAFAPPEFRPMA